MTDDPTPWSVQLSPSAIRAIDRLPHKVAAAIAAFITATLPTDPYSMSKPLRFELEGWRVARRGTYRVVFRALPDDRVLYVGRIEHRAHAYRTP
jgi:mRNA interferase RelE/StbE